MDILPIDTNPAPIAIGARISAMQWGARKFGRVVRVSKGGAIVYVQFDGARRESWLHRVSARIESE